MSSTASKTPLQDPPTDKIAPVSCTLITILVSLNLLWEGVYCHELTSNLEIICDLYVQAHPKRDYKTKLLSCLRWKLLFTTLDDVTTCSYSEILNSSSRKVVTSKTKFLHSENKRYYFPHLFLSTYIVFIHIHLTEISRETVPLFQFIL